MDISIFNILLLGLMGVGKLIFINVFCNYFSYFFFDEVFEGDVKSFIYFGFILLSFENWKIVKKIVFVGKWDEDEGVVS